MQLPSLFSDVEGGGEGRGSKSESSSSSSSSASNEMPGKLTISRSMDEVASSLRTKWIASRVWTQRLSAGMLGR